MKRVIQLGVVMALGLLAGGIAGCSNNQAEIDSLTSANQQLTSANQQLTAENQKLTADNQQLKLLGGPPPSSLDQYFPPQAPAPVYLIEMFNLAGPMESIGGDLQKQDIEGARTHFQAFKDQYDKLSGMVPEWTDRFPSGPVNALGAAVDSGDPAAIGQAMGAIGKVCADCHLVDQVRVQEQYHWGNFDDIKVMDPVSNKELDWGEYMVALAGSFGGGLGEAPGGYQNFVTQYEALAEDGCSQCHKDPVTGQAIPRRYFVDADSMALINQLGMALTASPPDPTAIGNLTGAIGNDICFRCHLVHFPAQNAKDIWTTFADVFK